MGPKKPHILIVAEDRQALQIYGHIGTLTYTVNTPEWIFNNDMPKGKFSGPFDPNLINFHLAGEQVYSAIVVDFHNHDIIAQVKKSNPEIPLIAIATYDQHLGKGMMSDAEDVEDEGAYTARIRDKGADAVVIMGSPPPGPSWISELRHTLEEKINQ